MITLHARPGSTQTVYATYIICLLPSPLIFFFSYHNFPASEWQGHKKPLLPVSLEFVEKSRLRVSEQSGSTLRCLNLDNQGSLDIVLSDNRQHRALLLKVSKEYDLVRQEGLKPFVDFKNSLIKTTVTASWTPVDRPHNVHDARSYTGQHI